MQMTIRYDAAHDVYVVKCISVVIDSPKAVEEWERQIHAMLAPLNKRIYLLIDIDGFHLDPEMAASYGPIAKDIVTRYTHATVRYGKPESLTRLGIRVQASVNHYPSNIMPDYEIGLAAIKQLRAEKPRVLPSVLRGSD